MGECVGGGRWEREIGNVREKEGETKRGNE